MKKRQMVGLADSSYLPARHMVPHARDRTVVMYTTAGLASGVSVPRSICQPIVPRHDRGFVLDVTGWIRNDMDY